MSESMNGAVAVVTGGATGLGRALALESARRGARVMIGSLEDASAVVEELRGFGAEADWHQTDVANYAAVDELRARTIDRFGAVNILVNNAATGAGGGLDTADPEAVHRLFSVNIGGVFNGIRAFAESLKSAAANGGLAYVLNVGSEHSLGVPPHVPPMSAYTTAKYAVLGLTDTGRRDFAGSGVEIALLAPGWVLTERVREFAAASEEFRASIQPIAQTTDEVARIAFDELLAGRWLIVTNPASVEFASTHAQTMLDEVQRPATPPDETDLVHTGAGDAAKCPVVRHLPTA